MDFKAWIEPAAHVMEAAGVAAIVLGALVAAGVALSGVRARGGRETYRTFRQLLGRAILLGLEFLVAADIIETVTRPMTMRGIATLAGVILIRTFLSFTLEVELEGRWPWQGDRRKL